jgi:hypothetical protein
MKSIQELLAPLEIKKEKADVMLLAADDMKRKGIITHQQCVAIKNNIYRWFFDASGECL